MGRVMARTMEGARETESAATPFVLWEGGRDGASTGRAAPPSGDLSIALENPSLFGEDRRASHVGTGADPCGTTATMAIPAPAPAIRPRPRRHADEARGARAYGLDWRMIGISLLVSLAMALGAMAARGVALEAARSGLAWEDHRVVAGETLGSILAGRDLPDVGLGRLVEWVEERNGLSGGTIVPGQTLSVPR